MKKLKRKKTERDLEIELEEDYHLDLRKTWLLKNDDERYDVLPQVYHAKNVADFVDPDIMAKLEELEREEEARDEAGFYDLDESEEDDETTAIRKLAKKKFVINVKLLLVNLDQENKREEHHLYQDQNYLLLVNV